jgi:hypothetical protein
MAHMDNQRLLSSKPLAPQLTLRRMKSSSTSRPGAVLALGGATLLLLLLAHPAGPGPGRPFSDVVDFEIRHRAMNALVHGGALAVLMLLLAAHVTALRINRASVAMAVAVTSFGAGCAFLAGSLLLDGLLVPLLALQFRAAPDAARQAATEAVIHACGSTIGILQRTALLSFGASALAWCASLLQAGRGTVVGTLSGVVGVILCASMLWVPSALAGHAGMAGFLLLGAWQLALATALWRGETVLAG